jgi:hypothetical protein
MRHLMSLILLFGVIAFGSWKDSQAQTDNQQRNTVSPGTMNAPGDTGSSDKTGDKNDSRSRKNTGSSNTNDNNHNKNRRKPGNTGAKGRDSSGMGSESGTGGVPR